MAKGKSASNSSAKGTKNSERRCGKASKKHPGVSPGAHNGHTVEGYSLKPDLAQARSARKAQRTAEHARKVAAA